MSTSRKLANTGLHLVLLGVALGAAGVLSPYTFLLRVGTVVVMAGGFLIALSVALSK